ncbi:hypothetical protein SAMN05216428_11925 [Nitrosospira sp. Nsp11]|nr:hypothetical protein SAMN05216428_11925 [Nitrosospira sp. Nsp11]
MPGVAIFVLVAYGFSIGWIAWSYCLRLAKAIPKLNHVAEFAPAKKSDQGSRGPWRALLGVLATAKGEIKRDRKAPSTTGCMNIMIFLIQIHDGIWQRTGWGVLSSANAVERC